MTAKSEEELTGADLQTSKMQVEAADAAEEAKTKIYKSAWFFFLDNIICLYIIFFHFKKKEKVLELLFYLFMSI